MAFSKDAASVSTPGESLQKQAVTLNLTNYDPGIQYEPRGKVTQKWRGVGKQCLSDRHDSCETSLPYHQRYTKVQASMCPRLPTCWGLDHTWDMQREETPGTSVAGGRHTPRLRPSIARI